MKIPAEQVEISKTAGTTKEGKPVVFVSTTGGLQAFFSKNDDGEIVSLGAAPHKAIAKYLADQREPGIKWEEEFLGKSENVRDTESQVFIELRNMMWSKSLQKSERHKGVYLVYDTRQVTFEVMDKSEVIEKIKDNTLNGHEVIREMSMDQPASVLFMHPEFKGHIKQ